MNAADMPPSCRDCEHRVGRMRLSPGKLLHVYEDPDGAVCSEKSVLRSSPYYLATGYAPLCIDARAVAPCGLEGARFEKRKPRPPYVPPPRVTLWRRLLSWLQSAAPV